jgi:hypothetical protein
MSSTRLSWRAEAVAFAVDVVFAAGARVLHGVLRRL